MLENRLIARKTGLRPHPALRIGLPGPTGPLGDLGRSLERAGSRPTDTAIMRLGELDMLPVIRREQSLPPSVLLLADHLDAVLAAGEDLAAGCFDLTALSHPGSCSGDSGEAGSLRDFLAGVRVLEGTLLLRMDRARLAARRLIREVPRFALTARLFLAGTTALSDALEAAASERVDQFDTAGCPLAFMRVRGLIGEDCGAFTGMMTLAVDETMLVAGLIPLGVIMDQSATFLDVLDRIYDLFPQDETEAVRSIEGGGAAQAVALAEVVPPAANDGRTSDVDLSGMDTALDGLLAELAAVGAAGFTYAAPSLNC